MRPTVPASILALGRARAAARRDRDFREADRLRQEIEDAGYRVVDRGSEFVLSPAHPEDQVDPDGLVRHGWSGAVPSRLEEAATATASVVIVADAGPGPLGITLDGLRRHAPAGTHVVIVAPPDPALEDALVAGAAGPEGLLAPVAGSRPEVVRTAVALRPAAARNAGARRAAGAAVIWIQQGAVLAGDVITPVVDALADPGVAVVGAVGLAGSDVRALVPSGTTTTSVVPVAIDRGLLGFRRDDLHALGPLDERFFGDEQLDRWWCLVLRDGPDVVADAGSGSDGVHPASRRALAIALPIDLSAAVPLRAEGVDPAEDARRRKRDLYRVIDRFGGRRDLLDRPSPAA